MLHTHEVEGSSPPVSTKNKKDILSDVLFIFGEAAGDSKDPMRMSSGHSLADGLTEATPYVEFLPGNSTATSPPVSF